MKSHLGTFCLQDKPLICPSKFALLFGFKPVLNFQSVNTKSLRPNSRAHFFFCGLLPIHYPPRRPMWNFRRQPPPAPSKQASRPSRMVKIVYSRPGVKAARIFGSPCPCTASVAHGGRRAPPKSLSARRWKINGAKLPRPALMGCSHSRRERMDDR